MATTRRTTFKLYPKKFANQKLHYARKSHCDLYNAAVSNRKVQYKRFGNSVNYFDQQNCLPEFKKEIPEYQEFGSHTLQATLKRVDLAFQRFFNGLAKYPKFKAKRRYRGWTYPDGAGWKLHTKGKHRLHHCKHCGCREDRDINAAKVMIKYARGLERTSTDVELPTSVSCGSMRKVGTRKRQKPQSQPKADCE